MNITDKIFWGLDNNVLSTTNRNYMKKFFQLDRLIYHFQEIEMLIREKLGLKQE